MVIANQTIATIKFVKPISEEIAVVLLQCVFPVLNVKMAFAKANLAMCASTIPTA